MKLFDFDGSAVRVIVKSGQPWFLASDVCTVLDLTGDPGQHLRRLEPDEKGLITIQTALLEGGLDERRFSKLSREEIAGLVTEYQERKRALDLQLAFDFMESKPELEH